MLLLSEHQSKIPADPADFGPHSPPGLFPPNRARSCNAQHVAGDLSDDALRVVLQARP